MTDQVLQKQRKSTNEQTVHCMIALLFATGSNKMLKNGSIIWIQDGFDKTKLENTIRSAAMTHGWLTNWFLYSNHNLFWKSYMWMWSLLFFSLGRAIREKSILLLTGLHNWMLKLAVGQAQWEAALEILETDMWKVCGGFTDLLRTRPNGVRWARVGTHISPHNPCTWHSGGSLTGLLI